MPSKKNNNWFVTEDDSDSWKGHLALERAKDFNSQGSKDSKNNTNFHKILEELQSILDLLEDISTYGDSVREQ